MQVASLIQLRVRPEGALPTSSLGQQAGVTPRMGLIGWHCLPNGLLSGGMSTGDRTYQRILIDQANAEMGRQRISRRELARITGIPRTTMDRLFQLDRDMNVTQWGAIATALGFDPGVLARKATGEVVPPASEQRPSANADARTLIQWLVDHPDDDAELQARLSDSASGSLRGRAQRRVHDTIRDIRRKELENALAALPPSSHPQDRGHGAPMAGRG